MKKPALKQLLLDFGRYSDLAHLIYQRSIEEGSTQRGFHRLSIGQLSTVPTWQPTVERWLKAERRSRPRQLRSGINGDNEVRLVWPLGTPGQWRPPLLLDQQFRVSAESGTSSTTVNIEGAYFNVSPQHWLNALWN